MATGDKRTNFYDKLLMIKDKYDQYFFTFLYNISLDTASSLFEESGVLGSEIIDVVAGGPADTVSLDITDTDKCIDDAGHIMDLSLVDSSWITDYPFENSTSVDYYFGIHYQSIPSGVDRNPRSSLPEYSYYEESIGELDNPQSITDNTTYIRVLINNILDGTVDHGGRPAKVWLQNPVSPSESIAFYSGTIVYAGGTGNYIDIPYTSSQGPLGQTAPTYPISTTAADYWVQVEGLSWFKNTDIRTDPSYVFLAVVTGGSPITVDTSDQNIALSISLDRAYRANQTATPAAGRRINVDEWAVVLEQNSTSVYSEDIGNAALWVDKFDETTVRSFGMNAFFGYDSTWCGGFNSYRNLSDGVGNYLQPQEDVTANSGGSNPDRITFTRGGVDLTQFDSMDHNMFALVEGTTNNADDGIYLVDSYTATTIDLVDYDGSAATFPTNDTCTCRMLLPLLYQQHAKPEATSYLKNSSLRLFVPKASDGLYLSMAGEPTGDNGFFKAEVQKGSNKNLFSQLYGGKLMMSGGGEFNTNNTRHATYGVIGWAHFMSDKLSDTDLDTDHEGDQDTFEWGFDYRGNSFGKDLNNDNGPYQISDTARIPYSRYDSGAALSIIAEEDFTRYSTNTVTLTRTGPPAVDVDLFVCGSNTRGFIICELEYTTPGSGDGIYLTYDIDSSNDRVQLIKFDNTTMSLPAGSGKARFYGGSFSGNIFGPPVTGITDSWTHVITSPTRNTGGLKLGHVPASTAIGTTNYQRLVQCIATDTEIFNIRDAGQVYARALTTKSPDSGHGLTQFDMVETSLCDADTITGTLAQVTTIDVTAGTRDIQMDASTANFDVFTKATGSWTITAPIDLYKGVSTFDSTNNEAQWFLGGTTGVYLQSKAVGGTSITGYWANKLYLPDGCTLTQLDIRVNPTLGVSGPTAWGFSVHRKAWSSTSVDDELRSSTPISYATGGSTTLQTVTYTPNQYNIINNFTYNYTILIKSSTMTGATSSDLVYGCQATYTISAFGQNLIQGF